MILSQWILGIALTQSMVMGSCIEAYVLFLALCSEVYNHVIRYYVSEKTLAESSYDRPVPGACALRMRKRISYSDAALMR